MTFFVDANVLVYSATESEYAAPCAEVIAAVAAGDVDGRMSATALEEVWHLELTGRIPGLGGLTERAYAIFTPLLAVTDEVLRQALSLDGAGLGANDRIHAATCVTNAIEAIVTADSAFGAVRGLRRVDPLDERARRRLLSS